MADASSQSKKQPGPRTKWGDFVAAARDKTERNLRSVVFCVFSVQVRCGEQGEGGCITMLPSISLLATVIFVSHVEGVVCVVQWSSDPLCMH